MDDCANTWGTTLIEVGKTTGRERKKNSASLGGSGRTHTQFEAMVHHHLGGLFHLSTLTGNGSKANMHAIMDVTTGNTNGILIAAGSYVAGDGAILQSWSSCSFSETLGPSGISAPHDLINPFAKLHTIPLPYYLPYTIRESALMDYEDRCLNLLHLRCLVAKMIGEPITGLLLELILAANGTMLSDRALIMIGELAELHGFGIVVDEIMTGGRTGNMLLTLSKPAGFTKYVTHVTMGKWLECGLVLFSKKRKDSNLALVSNMPQRGASSEVQATDAKKKWAAVFNELENTATRRQEVLSKLKISEEQSWGLGILIFVPIKRHGHPKGTKNQLLPMIVGPKIDSLPKEKMNAWSRNEISDGVMAGVKVWIDHKWQKNQQEEDLCSIIQSLMPYHKGDLANTTWFINNPLKGRKCSSNYVSYLLGMLQSAGVLEKGQFGEQRHRGWQILKSVSPPWTRTTNDIALNSKKKARVTSVSPKK